MTFSYRIALVLIIAGMLALSAHADEPAELPSAPDPAPAHPELRPVFDEFGGRAGLDRLMDDFLVLLLDDPRTRPFFEHAENDRIKRQLAEQFCVILGGDCTYSGRDMREAHTGHLINRAHFNALVENLQIAMDRHNIPFRAQNALLEKLAPMYREIVNDPPVDE